MDISPIDNTQFFLAIIISWMILPNILRIFFSKATLISSVFLFFYVSDSCDPMNLFAPSHTSPSSYFHVINLLSMSLVGIFLDQNEINIYTLETTQDLLAGLGLLTSTPSVSWFNWVHEGTSVCLLQLSGLGDFSRRTLNSHSVYWWYMLFVGHYLYFHIW